MPAAISSLDHPVAKLPGVGSERSAQLTRLGVTTIRDLLLLRPRRHEDRRHFHSVADLKLGVPATVRGRVAAMGLKRWRHGTKSVFELVVEDGSGRLHCRWWNLAYMQNYFKVGDELFVFGKLSGEKPRIFDHPETEVLEGKEDNSIHLNCIAPVYPLTEGLPQRWLRALIWRTLPNFKNQLNLENARLLLEGPSRADALQMVHFPQALLEVETGRRRLALEELYLLQEEIFLRRRRLQMKGRALPCGGDNRLIKPFLKQLGYRCTSAQTRVLREIRQEMSGEGEPMRRLLQGDVGSGKTLVAACAALMALESGWNVVLMAPTEILAEQHCKTFQSWFSALGVRVLLRTSTHRSRAESMDATQSELGISKNSFPTLVVGTHALLEKGVAFEKLGLVIIDEQHKFGVAQREQLLKKGNYPHLLIMTATPIPRTLGLTLYGDLDVSVIDEMPAGRGSIKTFLRTREHISKVWSFVQGKLLEGQQAYVVYPRVEEGGASGLKAVTAEYRELGKIFPKFQVGLLHGRLKTGEKDRVMNEFRNGNIHLLVATSVIEVGVDVANATVMVIENAEQFGLAQLHQLRGRVGRGARESYCILVGSARTREARERLKAMETTLDGFQIAEMDLKLRGAGELLGRQQSGLPDFRFADLTADYDLIQLARGLIQSRNGKNLM